MDPKPLLLAAGIFLSLAAPAQTVYQVAHPTTRASFMPKASDVQLRTVNTTTGGPHDTLNAARNYYATRLDWIYTSSFPWVQSALAAGFPVEPTINWDIHDSSSHPERSRSVDVFGQAVSASWVVDPQAVADRWACGNTYEYRQLWFNQVKTYIDWGLYTLQHDDEAGNGRPMSSAWPPTSTIINSGPACFCPECLFRYHFWLQNHGQTSWAKNFPTNHFVNAFLGDRAFDVFMVTRSDDDQFGLSGNAENGVGGTPRFYLQRGAMSYNTLNTLNGSSTAGQVEITTFTHDGNNTVQLFKNGVLQSSSASAGVLTNFSGGNLVIPFQGGNTNHAGDVAEVIIYNRLLTDAQRAGIEAYLGAKYGGITGSPIQPDDTNIVWNLKLWLKADSLTNYSDGAAVTNWTAAAGINATVPNVTLPTGPAATAPTFKVNGINGQPVVHFDGTNNLLGFYWFNVRDYVLNYVANQDMRNATSVIKTNFLIFQQNSQRDFLTTLHNEINGYAGRYIPMSCNGAPASDATPADLFDYGIAELGEASSDPGDYYAGVKAAAAAGKVQTWTTPEPAGAPLKGITDWDTQWPQIKPLNRRSIASAYASGGNMFAPWDVFQPNGNARYFGAFSDYNYLFKLVRDNAPYFDGYDDAYVTGYTLPTDSRYGSLAPIAISAGSGKVAAFVRVKAGNPGAPAVIHLVECATNAQPFILTIQNSRFFAGNRRVHMVFNDAQTNTSYSVNYNVATTQVLVPALQTWAMVLLSVSNATPLEWTGTNTSAWDVNEGINWASSGTALAYQEGDAVQLDDTAGGSTAILLNGTVHPASIAVSNFVLNYTLSGAGSIAGTNGLAKDGTAAFTLATSNSYSGPTLVNAGALFVNGSISTGAVTVAAGARLGGSGTIAGDVTVHGGSLAPGVNATGDAKTLALGGNLILDGGSSLALDFASAPSGVSDLINLQGGTLTLNGSVQIAANLLSGHLGSGPYMIISNAVAIQGDVTSLLSAPGLSVTFSTNSGPGPYNVYMTSTYVSQNLIWQGTNANPAWDANNTINWSNTTTHAASSFHDADSVTFDDTAASGAVLLAEGVFPSAVVVSNGALAYGFSGSGNVVGPASLIKLGPGSLTLGNTTPDTYTGPTAISNGAIILGANNALSSFSDLSLGNSVDATSSGNLNLGSFSQTVNSLATVGIGTTPNVITIPSGQTLTVQNNVLFGYRTAGGLQPNVVSFIGGGSFVQNTTANTGSVGNVFMVSAYSSTSSGGSPTTVDMSGLSSANINLGTNLSGSYPQTAPGWMSSIIIGDPYASFAGDDTSTLILASNTTMTANSLVVGMNRNNGGMQRLVLGSGSNIFNINSNGIGSIPALSKREGGRAYFASASGSLKIRAQDGVSRANLFIGASGNGATSPGFQFLDLSGHNADLLLANLWIGFSKYSGNSTNYLNFSDGTLDTTFLQLGVHSGGSGPNSNFVSTLNLSGGTVKIGTSGVSMGTCSGTIATITNNAAINFSGSTATVGGNMTIANQSSSLGTLLTALNITGGSLTVTGNIVCGAGVANPGPRVAKIILNGTNALLDLTGHTLGGTVATSFIDQTIFQAGTLQNVSEINNGADLVKTGAGTLTLAGANSYKGRTVVSNDTLLVNGTISTGAVLVTAGTLGGSGIILGPVTVPAAGTLAPGANGIATLSVNNTLDLQGTTLMRIARNGGTLTNDAVIGLSTVTYGGTLIVTNASAGPLLAGDSFKLFSANSYLGTFDNIILPAGYTWTNRLATDGTMAVLTSSFASQPTFSSPTVLGTNLLLRGASGTPHATYYVLASTNLMLPANNWTVLFTNSFNDSGEFSNLLPLDSIGPAKFFQLKQ